MKKFFQEIKADLQFKSAGPGQKLSEAPKQGERAPKEKPKPDPPKCRQGPTNEAQMAAAAALARLEQKPKPRALSSQDAIRNQVKKELEAEAAASEKGACVEQKSSMPDVQENPSILSVSGVYFTCPLTGVTVRKDKRDAQVKEAILKHATKDPVAASIMEIHTFNRDREKVKLGVETIAKYLDNIHLHPDEEKYRKIKLQNKVFQERIHCLEGTHKFFEAVGFEKSTRPVPGQEETTEDVYVLKEEALEKLDDLKEYKEKLLTGEPVRAQLDRQRRIFKPSPQASHFELPNDFFNLTAEELKREQRLRTEAVEKASMLRTKAMREREEQRELRKYNYTLLRVRFPDGYILQGTFYAREPVSTLYQFVRETLQNNWLPFELLAPGGHKLTDESMALNECGLVPSALLTFVWDADVMADIKASGGERMGSVLKADLLSSVQILS
ncbi:UBX domain-containing protein 6 isoform X2 [Sceloporus undulatus]|uniref:UBX domain-containing protein 6 isoform X2 n=1 Tax=Sceloporus undulatus TaxID=8520 RepID=UPI001C4DD2B1|nr:UBX domain-containing protein 6 isoform X2 [Sceloporus undulatus]